MTYEPTTLRICTASGVKDTYYQTRELAEVEALGYLGEPFKANELGYHEGPKDSYVNLFRTLEEYSRLQATRLDLIVDRLIGNLDLEEQFTANKLKLEEVEQAIELLKYNKTFSFYSEGN